MLIFVGLGWSLLILVDLGYLNNPDNFDWLDSNDHPVILDIYDHLGHLEQFDNIDHPKERVNKRQIIQKLDRVGLIDNRPSTNKLHHFVRKKKNLHLTSDT